MAAKRVGTLIREARTAAGMTQEQLARKVRGASASDISQAERGLKDLTQEQLKQIAKATGVTQSSLLNAPKGGTSSAKKPSTSGKKKPASSTSSSTASKSSMQVTATERRLVEYYRKADSDTKKSAMRLLKGEDGTVGGIVGSLLEGAASLFTGKKEMPAGETEAGEE